MKKPEVSKYFMEKIHPYIPEGYDQLRQGRVTRREFLRLSTLLGMSAGTAAIAAACGQPAREAPPDPTEAMAEDPTVVPEPVGPSRGGTIRTSHFVSATDHPARFSGSNEPNVYRQVFEYLATTDENNVTHPTMLEGWTANDDLTVWDLNLRQGIKWTNGDDFVAEHVKWNFKEWLNPETSSSIWGLWEKFLTLDNLEVVNEYTVRLHLDGSLLPVPENLFHYPSMILHPSFNGDITTGDNPSTGAHILEEHIVEEWASTVARWAQGDEGYWQMGEDGKPLTYFERMEFINFGEETQAELTALQTGEIDFLDLFSAENYFAVRDDPKFKIQAITTGNSQVFRMRVDLEPWTDNRIRTAVKKIQNREKILANAFFGEGLIAYDTHSLPVHPEFAPMADIPYDPEGARALLDDVGMETLDFDIHVPSNIPFIIDTAQTMAEDAAAAGINITVIAQPRSNFWEGWLEHSASITHWSHRPLAVMILPLAYTADAPWNESRWVDEEFDTLLNQARGTLDIEARRAIMTDVQRIQSERGSVGISFCRNSWSAVVPGWQGIKAHPTRYWLWNEVYYDPDMAG